MSRCSLRLSAPASLLLALAVTASSAGARPSSETGSVPAFGARVIQAQNRERASLGLSNLSWDPALASSADTYAIQLAASDKWQHSPEESRKGEGENLWMGTHGAFTAEQMVGGWLDERSAFRAGTFPDVSKTGNWEDVGHYTQIIWDGKRRVGCSLRSSARYDYLVCRYASPGNVMGQNVLPSRLASTQ